MEELIAECPQCRQRMRAPFLALGKTGRCPACGHRFTVRPAQIAQAESDAPAPADWDTDGDPWGSDPGQVAREENGSVASFVSPSVSFAAVAARPPEEGRQLYDEQMRRLNADVPSQEIPAGEPCPRCNRPYRGIWDKEETSEGVMCHRCANLIVGQEPSIITRDAAARAREHPPTVPMPDAVPPLPFHERYRSQLIYLAASVGIMLLVLVLPVEQWVGNALYGQIANASPTMHGEWNRALAILKLVLGVVGYYVALHMTFQSTGRFEDWTWPEKVPYVLKGASIIYLWMIVCTMVSWYPLVGMLLFGMGAALLPFILWSIYQLSVSEFLILALYLGLTYPLLWALGHLLYGVLALVIT
ncbi:MAG: hypothetical protein IT368_06435 [Candidatus Hydrogenedentes bacterium]|nr:hypothetical protein [Candidatus Hydrogenedentota bacterium]